MVNVVKATGEIEPFSEDKLRYSIKRAGIPQSLQNKVVSHIKSNLYENIPTTEIYDQIEKYLTQSPGFPETKYSLKRAIMELGPTGYPFEDFIAEVFKSLGYETKTNLFLSGKCVNHEIDVLLQKNDPKRFERIMIEAKFHNSPGTRTDVQVVLYTKARFDDLREKYNLTQAWVITNTKITADAIAYALCENIKVTGWNYPEKQGLRDLVEKEKLYPITVLTTLSDLQKQELLERRITLCKTICEKPNLLQLTNLTREKKEKVLTELKYICS